MDADAALGGDAGGFDRRHLALGVVAVGQRDDGLRRGIAFVEEADTEADRVAEGSPRSGHADGGFLQQLARQAEVGRERRLQEGRVTEDHQPDAITLAARQEVAEHLLHGGEPVDRFARGAW